MVAKPLECLYSVIEPYRAEGREKVHEATNDHSEAMALLRRDIPPVVPATAKELERRREVIQRILRHRERVGPIGIRADDLLHEARTETER